MDKKITPLGVVDEIYNGNTKNVRSVSEEAGFFAS